MPTSCAEMYREACYVLRNHSNSVGISDSKKMEVELQGSERNIYEEEGERKEVKVGRGFGGGGRDFEIDAFLVESYVFCMSADRADTAEASGVRG
jgi:hypothetical protein